LAVHDVDGKTSWHTIVAFRDRAAALQKRVEQGDLVKGREVDVIGFLHTKEEAGRDGTPKKVEEVYVVAVKKR